MIKRFFMVAAGGFVAAFLSTQVFSEPAAVCSVKADIDRLEHKIQAREPGTSTDLLLMHLKAIDDLGTFRPVQQILEEGAEDQRDWVVMYFSRPNTGARAAVFVIQDGESCLFGRYSSRSVPEHVLEACGDFDVAGLTFRAGTEQPNIAFDGASRVVTVSVGDRVTSHLKAHAREFVSGYEISLSSVVTFLKQAQDSSWDY